MTVHNPNKTPLAPGHFDYRFKKQTCCPGHYARVIGYLEPCQAQFIFENQVQDGAIPREFIPACEQGFREATQKGMLAGYPVTGVKVVLTGGNYHQVDSRPLSFRIAARKAFRQAYTTANPILLEPWMQIWINTSRSDHKTIQNDLLSRRACLLEVKLGDRIHAQVPLREMLGYREQLRSLSSGQATFNLEFFDYRQIPQALQQEIICPGDNHSV